MTNDTSKTHSPSYTLSKMAILQDQLEKMKRENEGLRSMVSQVKERYVFLQRHIQENIISHETSENIKVLSHVSTLFYD
jgi:septation ring formation regulator EzrA